MNVFSTKPSSGIVAPWTETFAFGKDIRNYYESLGNVLISSPAEVVTALDGAGGGFSYSTLGAAQGYTELAEACGGGGWAGNPPGGAVSGTASATTGTAGTGGKLIIICYGNVTVNSNGKIESNGSSGRVMSGDGSGVGHVSIIHGGTYTNNGKVQAAGGAGGIMAGYCAGGAGSVGSVVTKTFTQMGWS